MKVLTVMSMKGGVGKTTLSANLAVAFARAGHRPVVTLDLDPQNGLAWHFDGDLPLETGLAESALAEGWIGTGYELNAERLIVFPHGRTSEAQRIALEERLAQRPGWLGAQLRQHFPAPGGIAVIDTPPGHSVYLEQALACADHLLIVLKPDVSSVATVSAVETLLEPLLERRPEVVAHYLFNQVEPDHALSDELMRHVRARFGPRVLPLSIRRDERVAEALAFQQPLLRYIADDDGAQDGAEDIQALAARLGVDLAS